MTTRIASSVRFLLPLCAAFGALSAWSNVAAQRAPQRAPQRIAGAITLDDENVAGRLTDRHSMRVSAGEAVVVDVQSFKVDTVVEVMLPNGQRLENDDWQGDRWHSRLEFTSATAGEARIAIRAFDPNVIGPYRLSIEGGTASASPAAGNANAIANGAQPGFRPTVTQLNPGSPIAGELAEGDVTLSNGAFVDEYVAQLGGDGTHALSLRRVSGDVPRIRVTTGNGSSIDRGASGEYLLRGGDTYYVQVFAARRRSRGRYELALSQPGTTSVASAAVPSGSVATLTPGTPVNGTLAQNDPTMPAGQRADFYDMTLAQGDFITVSLNSSVFDTLLVVNGPGGENFQNDDSNSTLNSQLAFQVYTAGVYRVIATSYGDATGAYQLSAVRTRPSAGSFVATGPIQPPQPGAPPRPANGGAGLPAPLRGALAQSDSRDNAGRFTDSMNVALPAGQSLRILLNSTAFDTMISVRTPSGQSIDNDDITQENRNSAVEIPFVEGGNYQVTVTSYRPGDTGDYVLSFERGTPVPSARNPAVAGNGGNASTGGNGGANVYGIFAGITDYPGGISDLDECANDARKMVETLSNNGLITPDRYVLLTDSQVTRSAVTQAFQRFSSQMGPNDVFVFFFSGHGARHAITAGSDLHEIDDANETIVLYDGELLDDDMSRMYDSVRARTAVLALDTCFSGGFAKDVISRPGRIGLFSSEEDVTSAVASRFQAGGYLSHFLREGLAGAADANPRDGVLNVGEMMQYVWRQFGSQANDIRMGAGHQRLVIDRGAVSESTVLWAYR
jgi:hypothetical protein